MLKTIYIDNFKSFKDFEIEIDKFNIIIAPNNAGKSNFLAALNFLKYATLNPDDAIEEFGGFDKIKNIFLNKEKIHFRVNFYFKKLSSIGWRFLTDIKKEEYFLEVLKDIEIVININIYKNKWNCFYHIKGRVGEKNCDALVKEKEEDKNIRTFPFEIKFETKKDNDKIISQLKDIQGQDKDKILYALKLDKFINSPEVNYTKLNENFFGINSFFNSYNFYTEKIKREIKGGNTLNQNGTNLVSVLSFIKEKNPDIFETISDSLVGIVSELNKIKISKDLIDRNILLFGEKSKFLPIDIISDGTLHIIALATAIFEPKPKKMVAFDEIEKHLHLKAIDYIINILKEQSFQTIMTTQNSEILNTMDKKDNLIFLYRDYEGFTKGLNARKIENLNKKIKRYKKLSTIIKNEILGYLGDYDEK